MADVFHSIPLRLLQLLIGLALYGIVGGIWLIGVATGIYLGARFGPGPRDGLMTGLHKVTGWPIWIVRTLIEIVVVISGWLLGGDAWIGTLAFALLIGPIVHLAIPWFGPRPVVAGSAAAGSAEPAEVPVSVDERTGPIPAEQAT